MTTFTPVDYILFMLVYKITADVFCDCGIIAARVEHWEACFIEFLQAVPNAAICLTYSFFAYECNKGAVKFFCYIYNRIYVKITIRQKTIRSLRRYYLFRCPLLFRCFRFRHFRSLPQMFHVKHSLHFLPPLLFVLLRLLPL